MEKYIEQTSFTDERALYRHDGVRALNCSFDIGESPLKHSRAVCLEGCLIRSRYPLWYSSNASVENCTFFEDARAGMWYSDGISIKNSVIASPKNFRRSKNIALEDVTFSSDPEALWECDGVSLRSVTSKGDYFAMNSQNITVDGLSLVGKYSFDGVKNVTIRNSHLVTKDAFWNSENVTVYDSTVIGEYLGWNAKNLTLVNCTLESLQGFCYVDGLTMKNCRLLNTTLAFEYSKVDVEINGKIDGVFNPAEGIIVADGIGELVHDGKYVDTSKTEIIIRK